MMYPAAPKRDELDHGWMLSNAPIEKNILPKAGSAKGLALDEDTLTNCKFLGIHGCQPGNQR